MSTTTLHGCTRTIILDFHLLASQVQLAQLEPPRHPPDLISDNSRASRSDCHKSLAFKIALQIPSIFSDRKMLFSIKDLSVYLDMREIWTDIPYGEGKIYLLHQESLKF